MKHIEQKELENLITRYNQTDSIKIKRNLNWIIDDSIYKRDSQGLGDKVGLNVQTIYLYRQFKKQTNISFEIAVKLANALGVHIEELLI